MTAHRVKFGDVVQLSKARCADPLAEGIERHVGLEHLEPGDLRVRSWGNVADGTTFTNVFRPGQVLFGKRRAYQRKVAVADFSGVCSGDIYVLESKDAAVLLPELLPFICQTDAFFEHAVGTSAGSLSPRTNWTSLEDFEFDLPPTSRQEDIIRTLKASSGVIDSLHMACSSVTKLLKATRNQHFEAIGRSEYFPLATAVVSSAYGPRFPAKQYCDEGSVRTIRTTDMPDFGELTLDTAPFADLSLATVREHQLEDGDFLISRTGFTSGRAAVFRADGAYTETFIPAAFIVRLRMDKTRLSSSYLLEYVQSQQGWSMIRGLQRGTQQLNISASALMAQRVPIPALNVQEVFLESVHEVNAARESCQVRTHAARRLHDNLVNSILEGGVK